MLLLVGAGAGLAPLAIKAWERQAEERRLVELANRAGAMLRAGDADAAERAAQEALELRDGHPPARRVMEAVAALRQREARREQDGRAALEAAERWLDDDQVERTISALARIKANEAAYGAAAVAQAAKRLAELESITGTLELPPGWPTDAEIRINGEAFAVVDGKIPGLPLGRVRVAVSRPGHRELPEDRLAIPGGRPVVLPMPEWRLLPGRVTLASNPAGAAVWANGEDTHRVTPCEFGEVEPGPVEFLLKLPRHADAVVRGEVPSAGDLALSATLSELPLLPVDGAAPGERRLFNISSSLRVAFRWCPPGSFVMGTPGWGGRSDERPVRQVGFSRGFWLGETEFTQAQWEGVMGRDSLTRLRHRGGGSLPDEPEAPAVGLSWDELCGSATPDGDIFGQINRFFAEQRVSGWVADLPSEAQWEYACRAGTTGMFAIESADERELAKVAWFAANSGGRYHPVGSKAANPWGFHDMHGNVAEWCRDSYQADYRHLTNRDPGGPASGWKRVHRGGSYLSPATQCRSAARGSAFSQTSHPGIGFRLLLRSSAAPPVIAPPPPPPPPKPKPKPLLVPKMVPKPKPPKK
jgi:formylglycine-generating enzyme required for sulfatase activity